MVSIDNKYKSFVSIIVPSFNHGSYLEQRINSILQQSFNNFELVILDDLSTDNSREIIEKYRSHAKISHIVYNDINSGTTFKQWQKGLALAKGELIWIAESDDYCEPTFLQTAVTKFDSNKEANLFFTRSYQVDENNQIISNTLGWSADRPDYNWAGNFEENGRLFIERCMVQSNIIVNASAVVFRKAAIPVSIFSTITGLRKMGDWLFWVSCLLNGRVAYYGQQPLNYFREHQQSTRYVPNLPAMLAQKVEKYFVLTKIQEMLSNVNLKQWVDKGFSEMIMMTPVSGYNVLKTTLLNIAGIHLSFSAYLYHKLIYSVQHKLS